MNCELISVGTEILLGDILNTNVQYLSKALASIGIGVTHHTTVGDNAQRLLKALDDAFQRCDTVILTGGLGPTPDDLTKETCCKYFGISLKEDSEILNKIERIQDIQEDYRTRYPCKGQDYREVVQLRYEGSPVVLR